MPALLARSLVAFWAGMFLIGIGIVLDPPLRLLVAINPDLMD